MSESPWLRIGGRNLGRNRKRTVLTALGLAVGFFAVVFIVGWSQGIMVEIHPNQEESLSDGPQALRFPVFQELAREFFQN